ncbi:hypothetical protein VCSRO184_3110 [Vibrio cholerae]|nr:hypothetical protein VCSRO184_3110 [Vibrio cholerae]
MSAYYLNSFVINNRIYLKPYGFPQGKKEHTKSLISL